MRIANIFLAFGFLVVAAGALNWKSDGIIEWADGCIIGGLEIDSFPFEAIEDCGNSCKLIPECKYFEATDLTCVLKNNSPFLPINWFSEVSDKQTRCGYVINVDAAGPQEVKAPPTSAPDNINLNRGKSTNHKFIYFRNLSSIIQYVIFFQRPILLVSKRLTETFHVFLLNIYKRKQD